MKILIIIPEKVFNQMHNLSVKSSLFVVRINGSGQIIKRHTSKLSIVGQHSKSHKTSVVFNITDIARSNTESFRHLILSKMVGDTEFLDFFS